MQVGTRNTSTLPIIGPSKQKPSQVKFVRPAQMSLFAKVSCYPPLGQVTCVRRRQSVASSGQNDTLRFTVVLESSSTFPEQAWEAQIWHNIGDKAEWNALPLDRQEPSSAPLLSVSGGDYSYIRHVFAGDIDLPASAGAAQFTVRYRTRSGTEWQWANQQRPISDGELVFPARGVEFGQASGGAAADTPGREELGKYIDNISYDVTVESRTSESPGSALWSVLGKIDAASGGQSGRKQLVLGRPSSTLRYFALVRVWAPWLAPRHGKSKFRLTEDAILCSFLRDDGTHLVLLAISGIQNVLTVFQSSENGELVISAKNDNEAESDFQVLVSVAVDFEVAICAVIYEARKLVQKYGAAHNTQEAAEGFVPSSPLDDDVVVVEKDPKAQWLSEWFDGLTYCTWNALGQDLTEDKILKALDDWKAHGVRMVNLIIDDNWQSLSLQVGDSQFKRGWREFEANPGAFPRGLKSTVETFKQAHDSLENVAVWHALMGYWGGIAPGSELAAKYRTKEVQLEDPVAGGTILAIDPEDIFRFFDDFYSYLKSTGVNSVKTDAQFYLDLLDSAEDRRRFIDAYQDAWSIASLRHFGSRSISCMSMTPQLIFHSQMPTNKPSILLRNSDDFFPDIPASHPWHVFCNAHNALLTRYLNVLPDWDMFQTSHDYASFHAASRCVSGGPIYVTDEPGKHDLHLINQMTAPTTRGRTVILRPSVVGRTLDVYHDYNEGNVLRIGTYTGWAITGSGIIGLFNIQAEVATCMVSLNEFPGIHEGSTSSYIVRAYRSGRLTDLMHPSSPDTLVSVSLDQKGWEILTAYPVRSFTFKGSHGCEAAAESLTHVAILGLVDKMTGAAAVVSSNIVMAENGRLRFDINLKALGTLGIYFSDLQDRTIAKNFLVTIAGRVVPRKTVWKEGGDEAKVLAVDVLAAWKTMGLDSEWSNEVFVQVFVG